MPICKIRWIIPAKGDVPTPDDNPAVGHAVCFSACDIEAYPICAEHLQRIAREGWMFLHARDYPTPESVAAKIAEVKVVVAAILKAFPDQGNEILPTLRNSGDHYSFIRWGMYVGVESDGYIHT